MNFLNRFKKPAPKQYEFGFKDWRNLKFCWLPVKRYAIVGGDFYNDEWRPGTLIARGTTWLRWAELTKNIFHGWIHIEER